jgi:hypothetical protein
MVLAISLTGLVACGSDPVTGTDTNEEDTTVPTDTNVPDEGTDTTVRPDVVDVDTIVTPDVPVEVCDPACGEKVCGPSACEGVTCGPECDSGYVCEAGVCIVNAGCVVADECGDKECGDSPCLDTEGVAIPCGTCDVDNVCNEMVFKCYPTCTFPDDLPTTWGKAGVVNYLRVPANAEEKLVCFDYTGDDLGDCGLTGLASQVNPPLTDMMDGGDMAIIFEFAAVTDFTTTADFTMKGLLGAPVVAGTLAGDMTVDQSSYMEDTCLPMIFFEGSSIAAGALAAGPGNFRISVPLSEDLLLTVNLIDTQIKAALTADDTGVSAEDGVLSGVVTKAELTAIIDSIQVECDKDPQPESVKDICPYLAVARGAMAMLFDLHQDDTAESGYIGKDAENPGDAASLCLNFTLAKAAVTGYTPL